MFATLPASAAPRRRGSAAPAILLSMLGHAAMLAAAASAMLPAAPAAPPPIILDSLYPYVDPVPRDGAHDRVAGQVPGLDVLGPLPMPEGFPIDIPRDGAPDLRDAWRRTLGPGHPAAPGAGPGGVYPAAVVEDAPELLAGPPLAYPARLRGAGIQGRVVVEAVIDTSGRVELATVAIVHASHPAFAGAVREYLRGALFRPGRVGGRAVRVLVRLPVTFSLR